MGILLREGWTKALLVPILLKAHLRDCTEDNAVSEDCLDVDEWVRCPTGSGRWSKHVKVSDAYALVYYSSITIPSASRTESYVEGQQMLVESVSDVLFIKIYDQTVVDVEDADVAQVIQDIELMF